jgi:hypothetical protein
MKFPIFARGRIFCENKNLRGIVIDLRQDCHDARSVNDTAAIAIRRRNVPIWLKQSRPRSSQWT